MSYSKKLLGAMVFLIALMTISMVSALNVNIDRVEMDDRELSPNDVNRYTFERDTSYDVRVELTANENIDDVQIEAYLRGYDHDDRIEDVSDVFDMKAGNSVDKKLKLKMSYKLEKGQYKLRVRIENRDGDSTEATYNLEIDSDRHSMKIKDVVFSPSNAVVAGRSLLTTVRIMNVGSLDETQGIKVSISVPDLGITAADYIDEINEDDSVTSEELYLRIPACVKGGLYDAIVGVEYDDGDEIETRTEKIAIIEDELCKVAKDDTKAAQPKTIITVGPTSQDVVQGQGGVIYPLTVSNAGSEARTYVITADGYADWADVSVSPANIVVLQPGEAKALYVYISAKEDAQVGEHMFSLKVTSGAETLKEFTLKANVKQGEAKVANTTSKWGSVKNVLQIGLVVLVVLLVILGLIIGFSRLKGNDDDLEDEEGKSETYY